MCASSSINSHRVSLDFGGDPSLSSQSPRHIPQRNHIRLATQDASTTHQNPSDIPSSCNMCYFECIIFACGDWKWGNFKYHCTHEYRIGETCGLKFVAFNQQESFQCRICDKIDTKLRRRQQEVTRLELWAKEGRLDDLPASVEKSHNTIGVLDHEIALLRVEKEQRYNDVNGAARRR